MLKDKQKHKVKCLCTFCQKEFEVLEPTIKVGGGKVCVGCRNKQKGIDRRGSKLSEETKQKISEAAVRRYKDPAALEKLSHAGKRRYEKNPEELAKASALMLERFKDPEFREKFSESCRKRQLKYRDKYSEAARKRFSSSEAREQLRLETKRLWENPDYAAKVAAGSAGKVMSEAARAKISAKAKLRVLSEECKLKISRSVRETWADPELRCRQRVNGLLGARAASLARPTGIEKIVLNRLDVVGIPYIFQKAIGRYCVDFCVDELSIVIEADGKRWHSSPEAVAKDTRKDVELRAMGYAVLRLPEREINSGEFVGPLDEALAA